MATKEKLRGAFGSLSDTLTIRFDPSFPEALVARWVAEMTHSAAIANSVGDWNALPAESFAFDPVVTGLDSATHALVVAASTDERLAALERVRAALDALERLLEDGG